MGGKSILKSKGWSSSYWANAQQNPLRDPKDSPSQKLKTAPFHLADMSTTGLWMLRWYEELDKDSRLLAYAKKYAAEMLTRQDNRGFFPAWVHHIHLYPLAGLARSAESSVSVTFLLKLHDVTGEEKYKTAALKALQFVIDTVIPENRWEDFETHYSCSGFCSEIKGVKVARNNMYKQSTLSMFWTAEALYRAYKKTKKQTYLVHGQRVLDQLLMYQAVWQPPYLHASVFGGFGAMNGDVEWNDARQSLFAELLVLYGKELKSTEYVERGLAALRASFVLMYCPENQSLKKMMEKRWTFLGPKDYGFTMENYGHNGKSTAEGGGLADFSIFDWGAGGAAETYLRMIAHHGKSYIHQ